MNSSCCNDLDGGWGIGEEGGERGVRWGEVPLKSFLRNPRIGFGRNFEQGKDNNYSNIVKAYLRLST